MKKILSAIGKKNIIIISGILLIGIAIYLDLTLKINNADVTGVNGGGYAVQNDVAGTDDGAKVLGQAALVDNMNMTEAAGANADVNTDNGANANANVNADNTATGDLQTPTDNSGDYFAVSVLSRQRARDESLGLLNDIVNSAEAMPDAKDKAMQDIAAIAKDVNNEANIETLIKAKGFADCVAVVNGGNANIIVKTDGLMPNEVAQIKEIVYEQAGILPANTKIMEKN